VRADRKSHINVCVYDSTWEASDAFQLDESDAVAAWVKNDHLGWRTRPPGGPSCARRGGFEPPYCK
jgi:hypothetical protein